MEISYDLVEIKKSRKRPKEGDIFVVKHKSGLYFYGKVIKTNIVSEWSFINGTKLIYIYKNPTKTIEMPKKLDCNQLLTAPLIVDSTGWTRGFLLNIGREEVTNEELSLNYGFFVDMKHNYIDEKGEILHIKPNIYTDFSVSTYMGIAYEITKALESSSHVY